MSTKKNQVGRKKGKGKKETVGIVDDLKNGRSNFTEYHKENKQALIKNCAYLSGFKEVTLITVRCLLP